MSFRTERDLKNKNAKFELKIKNLVKKASEWFELFPEE